MTNTIKAPKRLRCAVYTRVSSDKQDTENSLDRQLRACRGWAERSGHILTDIVLTDEAKSGASMLARPAFQRLLEMLRRRGALPFDALLVDDDSRLDRGGNSLRSPPRSGQGVCASSAWTAAVT